jgi:hypothetical protein
MHHDSSATPLPDLVSSSSASASSTRQPQASLPGHDPATVLASARGCSSEEEALHLFQATLLDWVDDYSARPDAPWLPELKEAIVTLWIEYAQFQRSPKLAVEAFEAAVHCPVASHSLRLWTAYAQWLHSKNKPKAAQDLYLRALIGDRDRAAAELSPEERDALWVDFHALIVTLRGPIALSLQDFKAAVLYEHATTHSHVQRTVDANDPPAVVSALHSLAPLRLPDASTVTQVSNQLVHDIQTVSPDITAEWLARDGAEWPSRPEPPLFQTSPPKWLDASGKDVLGTDMALQLIRLLLKTHDQDYVGNALLEIAKACWMMNALKEKEASLALEDLDRKLVRVIFHSVVSIVGYPPFLKDQTPLSCIVLYCLVSDVESESARSRTRGALVCSGIG